MRWGSGGAGALHSFFVVLVWIFLRRHSGARLLPSFRRKPESILIFVFLCCRDASRGPAHVRVWFRPPSWRPSHFLCLPKESNQRKGTLEDAVRGHPCPRTPRAGSGVRRQYVRVQSTNSPPSWRRSLRDFSSTCSPRPGGDPGKSRARQSLPQKLTPRRPREGGDPAPLATASLCDRSASQRAKSQDPATAHAPRNR